MQEAAAVAEGCAIEAAAAAAAAEVAVSYALQTAKAAATAVTAARKLAQVFNEQEDSETTITGLLTAVKDTAVKWAEKGKSINELMSTRNHI